MQSYNATFSLLLQALWKCIAERSRFTVMAKVMAVPFTLKFHFTNVPRKVELPNRQEVTEVVGRARVVRAVLAGAAAGRDATTDTTITTTAVIIAAARVMLMVTAATMQVQRALKMRRPTAVVI